MWSAPLLSRTTEEVSGQFRIWGSTAVRPTCTPFADDDSTFASAWCHFGKGIVGGQPHVQLFTLFGALAQVQFVDQEIELPDVLINVEFCEPTPAAVWMVSGPKWGGDLYDQTYFCPRGSGTM